MQSMLIDVEVEGNDVNMDDWEGIFLEGVVVRVKMRNSRRERQKRVRVTCIKHFH